MLKSFKTEINPTQAQVDRINKTIGTCRFVYNLYIARNDTAYASGNPFVSGMSFSKWMNNTYIPSNPDKLWIKDVSSKSVKQAIMAGEKAFKAFFAGRARHPRFKKKNVSDPGMYFVRNNPSDCRCERHRIKIPTLGWVKLKEKGYLPVSKSGIQIRSGTVTRHAGRYYVSVLADIPEPMHGKPANPGIGIDLGIKTLATCSDGTIYENINKTPEMKRLQKKLKREQRKLSRKYENKKKGGTAAQYKNIDKQKRVVQRLHMRISNIRTDHINKAVAGIARTKPSFIAMEDLNVSGMLKNRHLSKAISEQRFYEFREKLVRKAKETGIEIRLVNRFYPSSKTCHACGNIRQDLKLSDRIYSCSCGYSADRDLNASLNLRDATDYAIA